MSYLERAISLAEELWNLLEEAGSEYSDEAYYLLEDLKGELEKIEEALEEEE